MRQDHPGSVHPRLGAAGSGRDSLSRQPLDYGARALKKYRSNVQLVLQDPTGSLNPRHSVYEAVAEGPRTHGMDDEPGRVSRALAQAGLRPPERFFLRYPHELSGGQRQRVVIAGALALDPEVIIADEPVSSLDASVRGEILALMLKLREELGVTLLVVTHDLGLAWNIADRIVVMYLGRVVEEGPTEQVLNDPQHPYTKALLSVVPEMEQVEPIVLTGEAPDPTKIPCGCRFHPRCQEVKNGDAEAAGILELVQGHQPTGPASGRHPTRGRLPPRQQLAECAPGGADLMPSALQVAPFSCRVRSRWRHFHAECAPGGVTGRQNFLVLSRMR